MRKKSMPKLMVEEHAWGAVVLPKLMVEEHAWGAVVLPKLMVEEQAAVPGWRHGCGAAPRVYDRERRCSTAPLCGFGSFGAAPFAA